MFESRIAAPRQTLWGLFWDVRSSGGGYYISKLINRYMFRVFDVYLMVSLKLHTSQGCFCPQTVFRNTRLNALSWNSLVSDLHYQLALSAGV